MIVIKLNEKEIELFKELEYITGFGYLSDTKDEIEVKDLMEALKDLKTEYNYLDEMYVDLKEEVKSSLSKAAYDDFIYESKREEYLLEQFEKDKN